MAVVLPHVKSGKLRALAVTGAKPTPLVPGVPSVAESGVPGFEMTSWWAVLGPAGMQQPIVARLNSELTQNDHRPLVTDPRQHTSNQRCPLIVTKFAGTGSRGVGKASSLGDTRAL